MFLLLHPLPTAEHLHDVAALDDGSAWVVGDRGAVLRVDPAGIVTRVQIPGLPTQASVLDEMDASMGGGSPPTATEMPGTQFMPIGLASVEARGPDDVWIAGSPGFVAHWDGQSWATTRIVEAGSADQLALDGERGAWLWGGPCVVSRRPFHVKREGRTLKVARGPEARCEGWVRGLTADGDTLTAHTDHEVLESRDGEPFVVRASIAADIERIVVIDGPDLVLSTGGIERLPDVGEPLSTAAAAPPVSKGSLAFSARDAALVGRELWVVGEDVVRMADGEVTRVPIDGAPGGGLRLMAERFEAIDAGPRGAWLVGAGGMIARWETTQVRAIAPRVTAEKVVGLAAEGEGWLGVTRDGAILRGSVGAVTTGLAAEPPAKGARAGRLDALRQLRTGEAVGVSNCTTVQLLERDHWRPLPGPTVGCFEAIDGAGSDALWAVGTLDMEDGHLWTRERRPPNSVGVADNGWFHADISDAELNDVAVTPGGDVWIAGEGEIRRIRGETIRTVATHPSDTYRSIHVVSDDDIWFAGSTNEIGSAGLLLHWDGTKLARHERLVANFLDTVAVTPDGTVWAFGLGGVGVRSVKGGWEVLDTGTSRWLSESLVVGERVIVGGDEGVVGVVSP